MMKQAYLSSHLIRCFFRGCFVCFVAGWSLLAAAQPEGEVALTAGQTDAAMLVDEISRQIIQLETSAEAFDSRIGELSFALAAQLMELERNNEALEAVSRADQAIKVRDGLYAAEREPLLRFTQDLQIDMLDLEEAELTLYQIAWLRARSIPSTAPEYLPTLLELARWHFARYQRSDLEDSLRELRKSFSFLSDAQEIYESSSVTVDDQFLQLYLAVNYEFSRFTPEMDISTTQIAVAQRDRNRNQLMNLAQQACASAYTAEDESNHCRRRAEQMIRSAFIAYTTLQSYDPYSTQVDQDSLFLARAYQRGHAAIQLAYGRSIELGEQERLLDFTLMTADWYSLFDYRRQAEEIYLRLSTWDIDANKIAQLRLDSPHILPHAELQDLLPKLTSGDELGEMEFTASISDDGEIESLQVTKNSVVDPDAAAALIASVVRTPFRPALANGAPIDYEGYVFSIKNAY